MSSTPTDDTARTVSRPRLPALLNLGVVGVVVVLVAAIALTTRQSPPPTVAEFAPQAVEQIEESLDEQAPDDVVADEGVAAGGPVASETPTPTAEPSATETVTVIASDGSTEPDTESVESEAPIERARVRKCVGDPPRQTEDPQSPPCVPFFDGDNGGATYQGVTGDQITIAMPNLNFFGPEDSTAIQLLVDHFNRRYEFYGRKIVLAEFESLAFATPDPAVMIADAVMVDEQLQAFATIGYGARDGAEHHYYDELARRGVVSAHNSVPSVMDSAHYNRMDPYQWSNNIVIDSVWDITGDFMCTTLADKPPVAGSVGDVDELLGEEVLRSWGVIAVRAADGSIPDYGPMIARLRACGQEPLIIEDDATNLQADNVMLQLSDANVTSVICVCGNQYLRANYFPAATNRGYFPEWVIGGYGGQDLDNSFTPSQADPTQAQNVYGITFHDRLLPRQQMPWYWAARESDPNRDHTGGTYYSLSGRYAHLLQIASGIQLAGPNLTPETFAAGLRAATFPNPGAGGAPQYQAAFNYATRHTARDSAALFWYDPQATSVIDASNPGSVCYIDGGLRYRLGQFPEVEPDWFNDGCIH